MSKTRPYHDEVCTLTHAANESNLARTTIISAIDAGWIRKFPTADGTAMVRLDDVLAYADNRPNTGPVPRALK